MPINKKIVNDLGILKHRCNVFTPNKHEKCQCGLKKNEHHRKALNDENLSRGQRWNIDDCTECDEPTDAYGEIQFTDFNETISSYIRVSYKLEPEKIKNLLFSQHDTLPKLPKLIISVKGAEKTLIKSRFRDVICKALVSIAVSTSGWLITSGIDSGISKSLGDEFKRSEAKDLVLIGITNWFTIQNRFSLVRNEDEEAEFTRPINYDDLKLNQSNLSLNSLNENHRIFLLVDDASSLNTSTDSEMIFRSNLETYFNSGQKRTGNLPVVMVLIEGDMNAIWSVTKSVEQAIPCIIINNSGKLSNVLSKIYNKLMTSGSLADETSTEESFSFDQDFQVDIKEMIFTEFSFYDDDTLVKQLEIIFHPKYRNFLSVFNYDETSSAEDLDEAFFSSLFKVNDLSTMAKFCLEWNRFDLARTYLFSSETQHKIDSWNGLMYKALINDRSEFIETFLENDFDLKSFLTHERLLCLYSQIISMSFHLKELYKQENEKKTVASKKSIDDLGSTNKAILSRVDMFIKKIIPDFFTNRYTESSSRKIDFNTFQKDTFENPVHELYVLSLLACRFETAKIFWKNGQNQIPTALVGSILAKSYSKRFEDPKLIDIANEFEQTAIDILEISFKTNETQTQNLLMKKISFLANKTTLQIAVSSNSLNFLNHICCQSLLIKIWYHKVLPDTPRLGLYVSMMLPFLSPWFVYFREKNQTSIDEINENLEDEEDYDDDMEDEDKNDGSDDDDNDDESNGPLEMEKIELGNTRKRLNSLEKIQYFMQTPFVKFVYSQMFYLGFLILFSYVLLCDFFPVMADGLPSTRIQSIKISVYELILIVWMFSFALDEVRKFEISENDMRMESLSSFLSYFIFETDSVKLIPFFVAVILRFIPDYNCYLAARIILVFDIIAWFYESLKVYVLIKKLGPKLVMIKKMLWQLCLFTCFFLVFMFAFGISTQALLYRNQSLDKNLLGNVFLTAFFVIGGEYYTRETIMNAGTCNSSEEICPDPVGADFALAEYVIYLVFLDILLINLLIAILSNTYETINKESEKLWKYQRYWLVFEYFHKPYLPAPFIIFYDLFFICKKITQVFLRHFQAKVDDIQMLKRVHDKLAKNYASGFYYECRNKIQEDRFIKWENFVCDEYLIQVDKAYKQKLEYNAEQNSKKLEIFYRKHHSIVQNQKELKQKLLKVENKLREIFDFIANKNESQLQLAAVETIKSSKQVEKIRKESSRSSPSPSSGALSLSDGIKTEHVKLVNTTINDSVKLKKEDELSAPNVKSTDQEKVEPAAVTKIIQGTKKRQKFYESWDDGRDDYRPIVYTSGAILTNPNADIDLLTHPVKYRPVLEYNKYDRRYQVDRTSVINYRVENGLPLFPLGRIGITGRGSLFYWGPNNAIQAIFTRMDADSLQLLVIKPLLNDDVLSLPQIYLENMKDNDREVAVRLIDKVFGDVKNQSHLDKLLNLIVNAEKIDKYIPDSNMNTDNAWIELVVKRFHDTGRLFYDLPLRKIESYKNKEYLWMHLNDQLLNKFDPSVQNYLKDIKSA